jgi:hypothetical protein
MPKKYQVIKATTRDIPGVTVGGRPKYFKKNGTLELNDAGEANEINKVLGAKGTGEVVVVPNTEKESGHKYTFGTSRKFADAWDAMMERRKAKAKKRKEKQNDKNRS